MLLSSNIAAFLLTFFGIMFIFAEILVRLKGIAGILGFASILLYFGTHLSDMNLIIVISLFLLAIILIIIDGKFVSDGTLSIIAILLMLIVVGISTENWVTGLYGVMGIILGIPVSFLSLKLFPKRKMWGKIALFDRLTNESGYKTLKDEYKDLLGKKGVTLTPLRPVGTIRIEEKDYSAISNGVWLEKDVEIIVVHVDGTKILVNKFEK
jgi:membrane-bound ClpP family serine protease